MGRLEDLAERYGRHMAAPWQRTVAGAQRVIMIVYDNEYERTLRSRKALFEDQTIRGFHEWLEVDLTDAFARWMASQEYRDDYFGSPADLTLKLDGEHSEFSDFVANEIRPVLHRSSSNSVVAVFGVGSLFGFARVSQILRDLETDIPGRMAVFFPGQYENNNYRLLDARDGWNYLAVAITMQGAEDL